MSKEIESPIKFRQEKNVDQPLGDNDGKDLFKDALFDIAIDRGFGFVRKEELSVNQLALGKAIGKDNNVIARSWLLGFTVSSPEEFGKLIVLFHREDQPQDDKLERLIDAWAKEFTEHTNRKGISTPERRFELLRKEVKPSEDLAGTTYTDAQIAREYRVSRTRVGQLRVELGLTPSPNRLQEKDKRKIDNHFDKTRHFRQALALTREKNRGLRQTA